MVTSKRRIETEKDRFGGFAEAEAYRIEGDRREISDDILNMRSYVSTTEKEASVSTPEKIEEVVIKEVKKATPTPVRRSIQDVMPEIIAPKRIEKISKAESAPAIHEKKLSFAAKRALIIYMSVVLAIVAGIIATGVAVSSVSAQVTSYETTITEQEEMIASQREELALLGNESVIADRAEELGMVEIADGDVNGYTQLQISGSTDDESGLFDNVRDWFNSVFGG
ncbi:MAG: hypothetical protein IJX05_03155 [Clostridia bacterium]|nr:hypothetical protein [Clostridia bacterium]